MAKHWIPKATVRRETTFTLDLFRDDILLLLQKVNPEMEIRDGAEVNIKGTPYGEGDGPLGDNRDDARIVVTWKVIE